MQFANYLSFWARLNAELQENVFVTIKRRTSFDNQDKYFLSGRIKHSLDHLTMSLLLRDLMVNPVYTVIILPNVGGYAVSKSA